MKHRQAHAKDVCQVRENILKDRPGAGSKGLGGGDENGRVAFGKDQFRHGRIGQARHLKSFRQDKVGTGHGKVHPLSLDFAMGGLRLGVAIEHDTNLGDNILHGDDKSVVTHGAQAHADEGE